MHSQEVDDIFPELKSSNQSTKHKGQRPFEIIPVIEYAIGEEDSDSDEEELPPGTESLTPKKSKDPNRPQPGQIYLDVGRKKWAQPLDCLFSLIGFAVAVSNIARFPYYFFKHGGIAFLIPYLFFLFFGAFPLLYMELIIGQFVQQGAIGVWKIVPLFKGIGYSVQMILIFDTIYYNTDIVWGVIYIFDCISTSILPWTNCDNDWNTPNCLTTDDILANKNNFSRTAGAEYFMGRILRIWQSQYADTFNSTNHSLNGVVQYGFNSDQGLGDPNIDLSICSFFIFLLIFIVLITGTKVKGKVVIFFVIVPYVILGILFFRGLTLPGAFDGIYHLFQPDLKQLSNPEAWAVALVQVFFSSGAGIGVHMTYASHNYFNADIYRYAIITLATDTSVSLFAAVVVFAYLGNVAYVQRKSVADVLNFGPALLFETYPDSIGRLSGSRFFAIIFFVMLLLMGVVSSLGSCQGVSIGVTEELQKWNGNRKGERIFIFGFIALAYVGNQLCLTRGGFWVYLFMDQYTAGFSLIFTVLCQTIAIAWVWGMRDLCKAVVAMTGRTPSLYMRLCWKYIAPASLCTALAVLATTPIVVKFDGETIPASAQMLGQVINYLPISCIFIYAVFQLIYFPLGGSFRERCKLLLCPENEHAQILATGSAGDRLTLAHLLYFGGWKVQGAQVRPTNSSRSRSFGVPSVIVDGSRKSSRKTESQTTRKTVQRGSSLLEVPQR